jgi:hypothetical protein
MTVAPANRESFLHLIFDRPACPPVSSDLKIASNSERLHRQIPDRRRCAPRARSVESCARGLKHVDPWPRIEFNPPAHGARHDADAVFVVLGLFRRGCALTLGLAIAVLSRHQPRAKILLRVLILRRLRTMLHTPSPDRTEAVVRAQ